MFKAEQDMNLLAIASSLGFGGVGRSHDRHRAVPNTRWVSLFNTLNI